MFVHTMASWLHLANRWVVAENGEVRLKTDEEHGGQSVMFAQQIVASETPVDLVIVGTCSTGLFVQEASEEFPMGECGVAEGAPRKSWLHAMIEHYDAKSVAIFPECCGNYSKSYEELLRRSFPEVRFIFLDVPDFYDQPERRYDRVIAAAIEAGIAKLAPATENENPADDPNVPLSEIGAQDSLTE